MDGYDVYEPLTGPLGLGAVEAVIARRGPVDVMMPGMSGVKVCQQLKASHEDLPVVILTARDDRDLELECYRAGADFFLTKPLLPGQLTDVMAGLEARKP